MWLLFTPRVLWLQAGPDTLRLRKRAQRLLRWPGFVKTCTTGKNIRNKSHVLKAWSASVLRSGEQTGLFTKTCSATKSMNLSRKCVGAVQKVTSGDEWVRPLQSCLCDTFLLSLPSRCQTLLFTRVDTSLLQFVLFTCFKVFMQSVWSQQPTLQDVTRWRKLTTAHRVVFLLFTVSGYYHPSSKGENGRSCICRNLALYRTVGK